MRRILVGIVAVFVAFAYPGSGRAEEKKAAESLVPKKDWRLVPLQVVCSENQDAVAAAFKKGSDAVLKAAGKGEISLSLEVPASEKPAMLTFTPIAPCDYTASFSEDSKDGKDGTWTDAGAEKKKLPYGQNLRKIDIAPSAKKRWVQVVFSSAKSSFDLADLGLYSIDPAGKNDYWVCCGASLQAQAIWNRYFKARVAKNYGYDPVIFNTAVSGWWSGNLRKAIPDILKDHPYARYVLIHIGGNNVTAQRPYPGGGDKLKEDVTAIVEAVKNSGKVPILARISYRAYKGNKAVPPEENGSLPYNTNVIDPLIKELCPDFYDSAKGQGIVDPYTWFKEHPDQLIKDGIHPTGKGVWGWTKVWADQAGSVVYGGKPSLED